MHVRSAVVADAFGIAAVQVAAWQTAYCGLMDQSVLDSLFAAGKVQSWEGFIAAPSQVVLVAEDSSQIAGYAHACDSRDEPNSRVGELASMYVLPIHWRQGLGTALLNAAEAALISRGKDVFTLWVLEGNDRARKFYERLGYLADGAVKTHPKSGLVEMRYRRVSGASVPRAAPGARTT